jgi:hypothetical protein
MNSLSSTPASRHRPDGGSKVLILVLTRTPGMPTSGTTRAGRASQTHDYTFRQAPPKPQRQLSVRVHASYTRTRAWCPGTRRPIGEACHRNTFHGRPITPHDMPRVGSESAPEYGPYRAHDNHGAESRFVLVSGSARPARPRRRLEDAVLGDNCAVERPTVAGGALVDVRARAEIPTFIPTTQQHEVTRNGTT